MTLALVPKNSRKTTYLPCWTKSSTAIIQDREIFKPTPASKCSSMYCRAKPTMQLLQLPPMLLCITLLVVFIVHAKLGVLLIGSSWWGVVIIINTSWRRIPILGVISSLPAFLLFPYWYLEESLNSRMTRTEIRIRSVWFLNWFWIFLTGNKPASCVNHPWMITVVRSVKSLETLVKHEV